MDFSSGQDCDPHAPPIGIVLDYLTSLYAKGLGYSAINTARSALSTMASTDSGQPVGKHPLVIRLLKGVFQSRPTLPRCSVTWDTDTALKHLRKLSPVRELSLKQLTLKLVVLIALLSGQRIQSIHLLDTRNMSKSKSGYKFRIGDLVKTSRPGNHVAEICFPAYPPDRRLCVVTVLNEYLERTRDIRQGQTSLLISYRKPHKRVSKDTIARWIKTVLLNAGIDMSIFTPHSTRVAASSAASKASVPLHTILKTAGWSRESTFAKYYNKPLNCQEQFANSILSKT